MKKRHITKRPQKDKPTLYFGYYQAHRQTLLRDIQRGDKKAESWRNNTPSIYYHQPTNFNHETNQSEPDGEPELTCRCSWYYSTNILKINILTLDIDDKGTFFWCARCGVVVGQSQVKKRSSY